MSQHFFRIIVKLNEFSNLILNRHIINKVQNTPMEMLRKKSHSHAFSDITMISLPQTHTFSDISCFTALSPTLSMESIPIINMIYAMHAVMHNTTNEP